MFVRDAVAFEPPLHRRVIAMAQLAGYRANTASLADQFCVGGHHGEYVRDMRTTVNVENALALRELCVMADGTLGERLRGFVERSGLSYDAIAKKAGYNGRSSIQRYFSPDYEAEFLPMRVATKMAQGFAGTSVTEAEVMALAGLPESNAKIVQYEGASAVDLPRDVPIFGTALGAPQDFDGTAVEQTTLNSGEIIGYLKRPTVLNGQAGAYGLYVQGSSMAPRFEEGETCFVTKGGRPPRGGDDVVVYLRDDQCDDGKTACAVLIKRLVRNTAHFTELEQFNPPLHFKIDRTAILRIDRVIPWSELLS